MTGERGVRCVEVRPSWSTLEWAQIAGSAASVGAPPATWTGEVLTAVLGEGPPMARYTQRGDLWRQLLERSHHLRTAFAFRFVVRACASVGEHEPLNPAGMPGSERQSNVSTDGKADESAPLDA